MSTGGTDIISCFAGQNPVLPVYRGEIQARNLAMAVECWNEDGESHSAVGVASVVWGVACVQVRPCWTGMGSWCV